MLEERRELFPRAGYLGGWVLWLKEAIERGNERARGHQDLP